MPLPVLQAREMKPGISDMIYPNEGHRELGVSLILIYKGHIITSTPLPTSRIIRQAPNCHAQITAMFESDSHI
jgi:hypothetical protein